jgi:isopenicillin N synthase-like dioxygenase
MAAQVAEVMHLPVIDISNPTLEVGKEMLAAATKYGFLYIDTNGTGFTEEIVDREFAIGHKFFSLSDSVKAESTIDETNRGWTGMHTEVLDPKNQRKGDFKEALNIGEFVNDKPGPNFPKVLTPYITELAEFECIARNVRDRILDLLAMGLGIEDEKFFSATHTIPSGCTLRLLHYPSLSEQEDYQPEVDVRAGAHSDYGSITLLFQRPSQPGLEILTPDNTWAPVPVFPPGYKTSTTFPPILVNIADLLSYWTNGLLKSTVHRVIFPKEARRGGEDRYSIAYFCHPANDTRLVPVPSKMVQDLQFAGQVGHGGGVDDGSKAMTAADHLHKRLEATYGFRMDKASVREEVATS